MFDSKRKRFAETIGPAVESLSQAGQAVTIVAVIAVAALVISVLAYLTARRQTA
jgi:hypothetical protein